MHRHRGLVLAGLGAIGIVAGLGLWLALSPSGSASARATSRLAALGPPISGLSAASDIAQDSPSCDVFRSCRSAAITWSFDGQSTSFGFVVQSVDRWAARHDLTDAMWSCGPRQGLFGVQTVAGCVAAFRVTGASDAVFVAVTFDARDDPIRRASWTATQMLPPTSPRLRAAVVRTIASQVVVGVGRFE